MDRRDSLRYPLSLPYNALLPILLFRGFGYMLTPVHYRRSVARPVSYYALFK